MNEAQNAAVVKAPAPEHPQPHLRWWIVGLLSVGMIIAYVERANISVALVVPEFKQVFGLTEPTAVC